MRTAAEIIENAFETSPENSMVSDIYELAINQARKECIEECAEKAQIKRYQPDPFLTGSTALSATQRDQINKQSILSLIKELK